MLGLYLLALGLTFALLWLFSEYLVSSCQRINQYYQLSHRFVGLFLLAAATSAPELFSALVSAWKERYSLVLANLMGSNISNILIILPLALLVGQFFHSRHLPKNKKFSFMFIFDFLFILFLYNFLSSIIQFNTISYLIWGIILIVYFFLYLGIEYVIHNQLWRKWFSPSMAMESASTSFVATNVFFQHKIPPSIPPIPHRWISSWGLFLLIIPCFVGIAYSLVYLTIQITQWFHWEEKFSGVLILALSTSCPEFITTWIAFKKNESQIAMYNLLGSNIFNLSFILGIIILAFPFSLSDNFRLDLIFLYISHLFILWILVLRQKIYIIINIIVMLGLYFVYLYLLF